MKKLFNGKLAVQQRVLPEYRALFFDSLAANCLGGLSLFAGKPRKDEIIPSAEEMKVARLVEARNFHLLRGPLYFCYQQGLVGWLKNWEPDALIVEANPRYLATPLAVRWMKGRNRPVIGWGLGAPPASGPIGGITRAGWHRFIGKFDALISYSQRGTEQYASLGFPAERIFVAPNSVSSRPTEPPPVRTAGFGDQPSILFVGRLQARKRIDNLLRACAELKKNKPFGQLQLTVVGDGPERRALEKLAEEIFPEAGFVGARHGEALKPYFNRADLFVLPGTGGLAVQQAMSHALPVIVARGDGTQDDLVQDGNGWQIPPDDLDTLTVTLRQALSDAGRLRQMGKESYRIVSEEINLEKMVAAFIEALNALF